MKKVLKLIGIFILIGIIGFLILNYYGNKFDKESKAYVDQTAPIIIVNWNSEELITYSHPELLKVASPQKLKNFFNIFSERLGNLKEYSGSKGEATIHIDQIGIAVTAEYVIEAEFEKAPAKIRIQLIKQNNKWQILGFQVVSEALLQ